jgi:hypothetical protein
MRAVWSAKIDPSLAGVHVVTIVVDPFNPIVSMQSFLFAGAKDINGNLLLTESGLANFADTAQLSIDLPAVPLTSNSGVLLTQAPQPAPARHMAAFDHQFVCRAVIEGTVSV